MDQRERRLRLRESLARLEAKEAKLAARIERALDIIDRVRVEADDHAKALRAASSAALLAGLDPDENNFPDLGKRLRRASIALRDAVPEGGATMRRRFCPQPVWQEMEEGRDGGAESEATGAAPEPRGLVSPRFPPLAALEPVALRWAWEQRIFYQTSALRAFLAERFGIPAAVSNDIRNPAAGDTGNPATPVILTPRPEPVRCCWT